GGELEQLDLVLGEVPAGEAADVQDADHLAARHQRDAEEGADAPVAQDRVDDVRVVDVLEGDRGSSRRDLPGETPSERDADPLAHLLLDAAGGGREEVPAGRV